MFAVFPFQQPINFGSHVLVSALHSLKSVRPASVQRRLSYSNLWIVLSAESLS